MQLCCVEYYPNTDLKRPPKKKAVNLVVTCDQINLQGKLFCDSLRIE